jgi:Luciferase-like monooxygenase
MVTAATFHAPALLVKAVTTLDVLSSGRAWLGIGAGYNADEAQAMGLFLPDTAERFDRMAELLQLARQMWSGDQTPFRGEYLQTAHGPNRLRPHRRKLVPQKAGDQIGVVDGAVLAEPGNRSARRRVVNSRQHGPVSRGRILPGASHRPLRGGPQRH